MPGFEDLTPKKGERALILGGTRSGKSCLEDMIMRYSIKARPNIRILLIDTKPRFRTELERFGPGNRLFRATEQDYTDWEAGPVIPGSVRVNLDSDTPLKGFWKPDDKCRVAVLQTEDPAQRPRLLEIADRNFFAPHIKGADRMLVCDELLDLYHRNSLSINYKYDVPLKVSRAGGERGFSGLFGAQRPKGLPPQITDELSILYLFYLRYESDVRYLWEMGIPREIEPPKEKEGDYAFKVIRVRPGGRVIFQGSYRLTMPDWYMSQLSET
jgi:hypothetical protein